MNFLPNLNKSAQHSSQWHRAFWRGFGSIINWNPGVPDLQFDENEICRTDEEALQKDWEQIAADFQLALLTPDQNQLSHLQNARANHPSPQRKKDEQLQLFERPRTKPLK